MSEKKDKHSFINDALEKRKQEHQFRTLKPLENQGGAHIIKNDDAFDRTGRRVDPVGLIRYADYSVHLVSFY